ncbi:polysaccharide biosynthesis protein [Bacillus sp. EB106-08-02-XG196]|jgi:O-antigen/teichoic acid export membrane protein|uniref:putative polysaccharide biosynthesis protein n=1 Tax=Bacillus sp. EB106-08-02-XG196 TaxID=2737049 RepID=UPI0015C44619|nr:polysaccharide biosynthesis protein [Bacillus sp. EB106-08-02-XG196]NWQ44545.1 polysaccharide biosynthesis protein [Bacillus sp. EB106-08-02-XG196]
MKPVNQSKALFRGAFILALAALITKILSAVYRIPFQNIVGDVGFYIYQQVYPFYGLAMVLATTGFPVVISKLYAEQREKRDPEKTRRLLFVSFIILQLFGLLCFLILYFGAGYIASWMNDEKLAILLRVVSIVFLLFPIVSIFRGYYQGKGDMLPTALSQVGEQLIRAFTILFLAYMLTQLGYPLYLIGGGAMFGSITGSMVSALILFTFLWIRKEWRIIAPRKGMLNGYYQEVSVIFKTLTFQGLTICISGMLMIFIQMADALNLYALLTENGYEKGMAKAVKGVFDRGQPLIQLGTIVAASMSLSLVPLITSARIKKDISFLQDKIQLAIRISIVIGVGASVGLWAIIEPANIMLFEDNSGTSVLGILSFVILLSSIITTIIAIMQGLGSLLFPAAAVLASFPLKYILNALFVPLFGTMGAAFATLITLALVCLLLYVKFKNMQSSTLLTLHFLGTLLTAALLMVLLLKGCLALTNMITIPAGTERLMAAVQALGGAFSGGFLFLFIIIRGGVFLEKELSLFPFGSKLSLLLPKKNRS